MMYGFESCLLEAGKVPSVIQVVAAPRRVWEKHVDVYSSCGRSGAPFICFTSVCDFWVLPFHISMWSSERENNENPNVFISTLGHGGGRVGERFPSVKLHDDGALDMKFLKGTCLPNFRCCWWKLSFQSHPDRPLHDMKRLRKLFQSKNIIRRSSRWIWRQSSRSSPLSQSTCVVKACCAGEDGEETLTTNAGKK